MDIDNATTKTTTMSPASQGEDYGTDIELDEELEGLLFNAESQVIPDTSARKTSPIAEATAPASWEVKVDSDNVMDIEDIVEAGPSITSPFEEFRPKGRLSVSDLVGLVWCEVQYDYRLRTKPYLPPSKRPTVITSKAGEKIRVDPVKVEGKERVLKRGSKIHKRLEKEIHPQEIKVRSETKEDVWGLRFLNMFAALEALLTLGKCRELPVIGMVGGTLVMGVIDEITREPLTSTDSRSGSSEEPDKAQTFLTSFFSPTKSTATTERRERTHRIFVSDSKTRASGNLPSESDTLGGRLQVMLYKELLDAILLAEPLPDPAVAAPGQEVSRSAILPTEIPFSWPRIFAYLGIEMDDQFSDHFLAQSAPVIIGNGLRFNVDQAKTLRDMIRSWERYVVELGLGRPPRNPPRAKLANPEERNRGRAEDRLELVYRRAGARKSTRGPVVQSSTVVDNHDRQNASAHIGFSDADQVDEMLLQYAINESLGISNPPLGAEAFHQEKQDLVASTSNAIALSPSHAAPRTAEEVAEEESAWAVEVSLGGTTDLPVIEDTDAVVLRGSQAVAGPASSSSLSSSASSSRSSSPAPSLPAGDDAMEQAKEEQLVPSVATKAKKTSEAGTIIGKTVFQHSPRRLAMHLASALSWWMGERRPLGVSVHDTRRCGWCEFEENCEWRAQKAAEAVEKSRSRRAGSEKL